VVAAALGLWEAAGVDAATIAKLAHVEVRIASPGPSELGLASAGFIEIDPTADGYGWDIDAAPSSDEAFGRGTGGGGELEAAPDSPAWGKVDLLTVVAHELGHELGLGDSDDPLSVMYDWLAPGIRRLPTPISSAAPSASMSPLAAASVDRALAQLG